MCKIHVFSGQEFTTWLAAATDFQQRWLDNNHFKAKHGRSVLLPADDGSLECILVCVEPDAPARVMGSVFHSVPSGRYELIVGEANQHRTHALALYWQLANYEFARYKTSKNEERHLSVPESVDQQLLSAQVKATMMVRDLINTPAEDMTPNDLCQFAQELTKSFPGKVKRIQDEALLDNNFPMIHAVGRASDNRPELVICEWGDTGPLVSIIGKGVTFDSGGLNLKPPRFMYPMKKDMGGAAHAIALAYLLLEMGVSCRIKLIVPTAENAISSNSYRPSDVLTSRQGKTVEVGDTDAEGRLLLADALAYAAEEKPDLMIDFATLTGAARVAMGPDVPCYFTNSDSVADLIKEQPSMHEDTAWRLPLIPSYRSFLKSQIADLHSTGNEPYGGAIITALFLEHFVAEQDWIHLDINAFNNRQRDGQPKGGEAQGLLTMYDLVNTWLEDRAS